MEKVGFVGLGIMGAAMAGNLLEAGHELVVHNRTKTKAEGLARRGVEIADSSREVAQESDVIITMLPGPTEVEEVVAGEDGLLEGAREGSLIVDMRAPPRRCSPEGCTEWLRTGAWGCSTPRSPVVISGPGRDTLDDGRRRRGRLREGETSL